MFVQWGGGGLVFVKIVVSPIQGGHCITLLIIYLSCGHCPS